jgi:predicted CoA-binding protein
MIIINDKELASLLDKVKTVAIVGAVDKPSRPVDGVGREIIRRGFDVIPVHPKRNNVWGLTTYPTLGDIPVPVDVVDLFRNAEFCPEHAREVLKMTPLPKIFWMQSGVHSAEAREILTKNDIVVIEDRCLKIELQRLGISK